MDTAEIKILNSYKALLDQLNSNTKLSLVKFLEASAKTKGKKQSKIKVSFGQWESEESADELIQEIHQNRHMNRQIEEM